MPYWGFPKYVSVAEKRAKAEKKIKQLLKKNPDIQPVTIEGRTLARTWWGKAWNKNLERYADYANRIGRGRSYVRHKAVLDLQIKPGKVTALVQGSASRPYEVTIKIKAIKKTTWQAIKRNCAGRLDSLPELLAGKFPKALAEIFTAPGKGLFPAPEEITFDCSCPDWASMCKHVAAALYGIGARLDENPGLFFKLRKVNINALISQTVADSTRKLLKKADQKSSRVMEDTDLSALFGIDLEDPAADWQTIPTPATKSPGRKKPGPKTTPATPKAKPTKTKKGSKKTAASKTKPPARKATTAKPPKPNPRLSATDQVIRLVRRSRQGLTTAQIAAKTGFTPQQVRNYVYRAKTQGKIKNKTRGVYIKGD